ncbi:NADP-dependent 3-hydroxy acid dehydrogenase YdfG [Sphingomonas jejuensis]|uniref:NADP-dependent 3-hydroxy acid dehydrogenase YdfG n=1 Tax=Sphingomonas jejuensis TaxID=904715 RepID=A0ABX0XJN7_9SPHN|nr:SDR family oxidoreductase [Sphingomonas jejuensis]NJC33082.1 NADP-dependent 3-hydroxy acid dehydrogenase YdfG [Sphingomonas jejuensis]
MTTAADAHTAQRTLKGRRIAVTGGTTGIGRAAAVLLASEGARLFVCGRNPDHLADVVARIGEVGEGDGMTTDLGDADNVKRFFDAAQSKLGGLDVAIINAAVPARGLSDMTEEEVRYALAVNFSAYVLSAHAAIKAMGDNGHIFLIGSMSAHVLGPSSTVYAGIKAGIAGFSQALRRELGNKGIKVSLVEPGLTGADFHYPDISASEQAERIKGQSMLRAEDIAVSIHFCLTQPDRTTIQQITVVPRVNDE